MKLIFTLAFVLLIATGCAGNRAVTGLGIDVACQTHSKAVVPFTVATVRERIDDPSIAYSRNRSPLLNFSTIDVHIPEMHRAGNVETASVRPDPRRNFMASNYAPLPDRQATVRELDRQLASRPAAQREIFVLSTAITTTLPRDFSVMRRLSMTMMSLRCLFIFHGRRLRPLHAIL